MDRIMKEYWQSNIDMGGNFFTTSTCYNILYKYELDFMKDYETEHRFYHTTDINKIPAHMYMMRVWMSSM